MSEIKALHEQCKLINAETQLSVVEAEFWTDDSGALEFKTRGPANTGMWIDWGDGEGEWIEHTGIGNTITTTHTYSAGGVKQLKFTGNLNNVTYFECRDISLRGDVALFSNFSSLAYMDMQHASLFGDIADLSSKTGLTYLRLHANSVTGNVDELYTLTALSTGLDLSETSVAGDIGGLSTLVSLTNLQLQVTSVSGDVGDLSTLTLLTYLRIHNTTVGYGTTTLPAWNNATILLQDNAWTFDEVDSFLIDLAAAGGTNGTLNIAGTNAARSAASDSAKATLLTNGWSITVNE